MPEPLDIGARLASVRERIAGAAVRSGRREGDVALVAVSKTMPADAVRAARAAGQRSFGESYAQELRDKARTLADLDVEWHFIGRLQSNKVKYVAGLVRLVHGVDSLDVLRELDRRAAARAARQDVLIEVGLAGESQKAGVRPEELPSLLDAFAGLQAIRCVGLMAMPPLSGDPEASRPLFRRLRELRDDLSRTRRANVELRELSMGMSGDFEVAVEEGATLVRVGTAIFGRRAPAA